jgi:hypothetical protein
MAKLLKGQRPYGLSSLSEFGSDHNYETVCEYSGKAFLILPFFFCQSFDLSLGQSSGRMLERGSVIVMVTGKVSKSDSQSCNPTSGQSKCQNGINNKVLKLVSVTLMNCQNCD